MSLENEVGRAVPPTEEWSSLDVSTCFPELCAPGFHGVRELHIEVDVDEMDSGDWFELRNGISWAPKGVEPIWFPCFTSHIKVSYRCGFTKVTSITWLQVLDHIDSYCAYHRCPSRSGTGFYF